MMATKADLERTAALLEKKLALLEAEEAAAVARVAAAQQKQHEASWRLHEEQEARLARYDMDPHSAGQPRVNMGGIFVAASTLPGIDALEQAREEEQLALGQADLFGRKATALRQQLLAVKNELAWTAWPEAEEEPKPKRRGLRR